MRFIKKLIDKFIIWYILNYDGILQSDCITVKAYSNGFYRNVVVIAVEEKLARERDTEAHRGDEE